MRRLVCQIFIVVLFLMWPLAAEAAVSQGTATVNINPQPAYAEGLPPGLGCLVCHADPKLKNDKVLQSLYFSRDDVLKWSHNKTGCAGCHTNYTEKPTEEHENISKTDNKDFARIARESCVKCHQKEVAILAGSAHGGEPSINALTDQPTCLDCHTHHDLKKPQKDKEWASLRHMSSQDVCGKCHIKEWNSYNDYYHGRAYKMGVEGAPSCWDCHGTHNIMYTADKGSLVKGSALIKTCAKCHRKADKGFTEYAPLIHSHDKLFMQNPLIVWVRSFIQRLMPKLEPKVET